MFGVDSSELLIIAVVALVVIGPKDLPRVMRVVGQWVGRARGMARHFRSGIDEMMRQSEIEELEKRWRDQNDRIMTEFPGQAAWEPAEALPAPGAAAAPAEAAAAPADSGAEPAAEPSGQEELPLPPGPPRELP
ncbi:MAG: Sec-independent protein translocase protein TatB [Allosphingosinicella sp.]